MEKMVSDETGMNPVKWMQVKKLTSLAKLDWISESLSLGQKMKYI